jgi:hypothetical protein
MKPETIERRKRERMEERASQRADLLAGLAALAERDGPESIWAELLTEQTAQAGGVA